MLERILKRTINGTDYTVVPLAAKAGGLETYRKLHKHLAPVVGAMLRLVGDAGAASEIGPGIAQAIAVNLGTAMGDPEFCTLLDKMFGACAVRGGPIPADHWDTHLEDHDELVACCLWVNYLLPFAAPKLRLLGVDLAALAGKLTFPRISMPT